MEPRIDSEETYDDRIPDETTLDVTRPRHYRDCLYGERLRDLLADDEHMYFLSARGN